MSIHLSTKLSTARALRFGLALAFLTTLSLVCSPLPVHATTTHHYVCSDFNGLPGGASCTSDVVTLLASGGSSAYDTHPIVNINNATWYVSFTVSGGSGTGKIDCTGSCSSSGSNTFTGSVTDRAVTFSGSGSAGLDITNGSDSFVGNISLICISDTISQCVVGGGGSTPTRSYLLEQPVYTDFNASSTPTSGRHAAYYTVRVGTGITGSISSSTNHVYVGAIFDSTSAGQGEAPLRLYIQPYTDSNYTNKDGGIQCQFQAAPTQLTGTIELLVQQQNCDFNSNDYYELIFVYSSTDTHTFPITVLGQANNTTGYTTFMGNNSVEFLNSLNPSGFIPYFSIGVGSTTVIGFTNILSVTPAGNSVIATSTSFVLGATGNLNSGDYVAGQTKLRQCVLSASVRVGEDIFAPALVLQGCYTGVVKLFNSSGAFTLISTTSIERAGAYAMTTQIEKPLFNFFGLQIGTKVIVATSTIFTAATSTLSDRISAARLSLLEGLDVATSSEANTDVCNTVSAVFNATYCLMGLFVPSQLDLQKIGNDFSSILSVGPWGFVGTTFFILNGHYFTASSSTLPSITIATDDLGFPIGATRSVTISPFDALGSTSLITIATSTKNGKTIRQLVEPGWDGFVMLAFVLAIFGELVGFGGKVISNV